MRAVERSYSRRITKSNSKKNQNFHPFPGFRYASKTWKRMEVLNVISFRFIVEKILFMGKNIFICLYIVMYKQKMLPLCASLKRESLNTCKFILFNHNYIIPVHSIYSFQKLFELLTWEGGIRQRKCSFGLVVKLSISFGGIEPTP